jgi:hypothetical protein
MMIKMLLGAVAMSAAMMIGIAAHATGFEPDAQVPSGLYQGAPVASLGEFFVRTYGAQNPTWSLKDGYWELRGDFFDTDTQTWEQVVLEFEDSDTNFLIGVWRTPRIPLYDVDHLPWLMERLQHDWRLWTSAE